MSLELNAIPSVEILKFYKEVLEQEKDLRGYKSFGHPLKYQAVKSRLTRLLSYLIDAQEGNLEADVYFVQKSCTEIHESINEFVVSKNEAIKREKAEIKKAEREDAERAKRRSQSPFLTLVAANPKFLANPKIRELAESYLQDDNTIEVGNNNSRVSYLDTLEKEMWNITVAISRAAKIKTVVPTGVSDLLAFIDDSGVYRASKDDIGYLTKEANNHINDQIESIRTKKSELLAAKTKFEDRMLEHDSIRESNAIHRSTINQETGIQYKIEEINHELEKLYEHVGTLANINKEMDVASEIEKFNSKIEDLEKVKQILETPEEQQKRSRLDESYLLNKTIITEIEEIFPKSIPEYTYSKIRWDNRGKKGTEIELILDHMINTLDERENFWLDQKDKLKSCVTEAVVKGGIDFKSRKPINGDKNEWRHSPKVISERFQGHTNDLITKLSEHSHKMTGDQYAPLKLMMHYIQDDNVVDEKLEEIRVFDEKTFNTLTKNLTSEQKQLVEGLARELATKGNASFEAGVREIIEDNFEAVTERNLLGFSTVRYIEKPSNTFSPNL